MPGMAPGVFRNLREAEPAGAVYFAESAAMSGYNSLFFCY